MRRQNLDICYIGIAQTNLDVAGMSFAEFVSIAKNREIFKKIGRYQDVILHCPTLHGFVKPLESAVLMRYIARGKVYFEDEAGNRIRVTKKYIVKLLISYIFDYFSYHKYLAAVEKEIASLAKESVQEAAMGEDAPCYYKSDLTYGYAAGGSLGHVAGVVNNLKKVTGKYPIYMTTAHIPLIDGNIREILVKGDLRYAGMGDVAGVYFNRVGYRFLEKALRNKHPMFIYHRSGLNIYSGIKYALWRSIPFVLEYNGSEVWVTEKWGGRRLRTESVAKKIERLNFEKATLIICVSRPLKEELIGRGIDEGKIIVVPNGVDTDMYRPDIDGRPVRRKMCFPDDAVVVGFIGTFGAWHGAEVLAHAVVQLQKAGRQNVYVLFIGDGPRLPSVKKIIADGKCEKICRYAGMVTQEKGRDYLAACDILVSPTVMNPDGTPFFGSPTKLFEYMAMGKAIVVSGMDQMMEICEDGVTALFSEPGSVDSVAGQIRRLAEDAKLRKELGENARREVCEKYTWEIHTKRIVEALAQRCGQPI